MTITLALIGCGGIARRHVLAMKDLHERGRGDFAVTAVCDIHQAAAQEAAHLFEELFGLRPTIYTDHQALIAAGGVDAVDLCLPHGLHHGIAIDCMEAGLHVLCEKPLGITIKASRLMAEAADRTGAVLSTAAPHRRQPGQRVAHWVFNSVIAKEQGSNNVQGAQPRRDRGAGNDAAGGYRRSATGRIRRRRV